MADEPTKLDRSVIWNELDDETDPQPDALTVLRPGDRVLVVFREANLDHVQKGLDRMREQFPDVTFFALVGADQVLVQPSEDTS